MTLPLQSKVVQVAAGAYHSGALTGKFLMIDSAQFNDIDIITNNDENQHI